MSLMLKALKSLGSPKSAFVGMLLLGGGAILSYGNPQTVSVWFLAGPLAYLSLSLAVAMTTNPRIYRRGGLLTFHIGLFAVVVLAGVGRLTFYDARVELLEGNVFGASDAMNVTSGPFHGEALESVQFIQGSFTVEYHKGLIRGLTHSHVRVKSDSGQWDEQIVGDDRPLVIDGYRFYTSFNKGYAPVVTWQDNDGVRTQGAIHMPSYPLFEHKQENDWVTPNGETLKLWLQLDTGLDESKEWVLNQKPVTSSLVVFKDDQRIELMPGEQIRFPNGTLRYDRLSTWMGYRIFYDPTLYWLFAASILSVVGLYVHFRRRFSLAPLSASAVQSGVRGQHTEVKTHL